MVVIPAEVLTGIKEKILWDKWTNSVVISNQ